MAGRYLAVEMQDESGDVIYPHTEADVVFTSDGKTVEENMSGDITEADLREMFNNIPPEMGSKLSVKEKIKKAFWHYMSLFKMQVLDSVEEIEANTDNGYIMGARAGAEIINNLGSKADGTIAVLTGTTHTVAGQQTSQNYPDGFNQNNCIVVGVMIRLGTNWYFGNYSSGYTYINAQIMLGSQVSVIPASGWTNCPYKIMLYKYA